MNQISPITDTAGYEADFSLWIDAQVQLLRERKFAQLDLDNLIEEIDSMGRSLRTELRSRLRILLTHLLKCQYQPERKSSSWLTTLNDQRFEIAGLLADSPSLERSVATYAGDVFPSAAHRAATQTGLPESTFPKSNPFSKHELLNPDFVP